MRISLAWAPALAVAGLVAATGGAHAASESVIYSFKGGGDGADPIAGLTWSGGTLYGATFKGGGTGTGCAGDGCGTVFALAPSCAHTVLHSFTGAADGRYPWSGLIEVDGALYGTASGGGDGAWGTAFSMTTAGVLTVLHAFRNGDDGGEPLGGLLRVGAGCTARPMPAAATSVTTMTAAERFTHCR